MTTMMTSARRQLGRRWVRVLAVLPRARARALALQSRLAPPRRQAWPLPRLRVPSGRCSARPCHRWRVLPPPVPYPPPPGGRGLAGFGQSRCLRTAARVAARLLLLRVRRRPRARAAALAIDPGPVRAPSKRKHTKHTTHRRTKKNEERMYREGRRTTMKERMGDSW